ncbi:uncharacterized protein TNCV_1467491 [Trichonephila clavipes]|uniref:Uncharacterized protein n=1 Tax=Trichonephila clavipes TaxID=2585209 RepID=A0A8X6RU02_TRICX|nr:uncharacterized protein TNCV_1467491 [Trichonephila clavipes]
MGMQIKRYGTNQVRVRRSQSIGNPRQPHESMDPTCQQGTVQSGRGSMMVWSVCSWHDMGPLIHLDTTLTGGRRYLHPPLTPSDLWTALQDSWCQLPPALLQTLIESIPRPITTLLCLRGGLSRY